MEPTSYLMALGDAACGFDQRMGFSEDMLRDSSPGRLE
jgi:hypothetical protein